MFDVPWHCAWRIEMTTDLRKRPRRCSRGINQGANIRRATACLYRKMSKPRSFNHSVTGPEIWDISLDLSHWTFSLRTWQWRVWWLILWNKFLVLLTGTWNAFRSVNDLADKLLSLSELNYSPVLSDYYVHVIYRITDSSIGCSDVLQHIRWILLYLWIMTEIVDS